MNSPHQKKGGFGCLAYGCLVAVIVAGLGALGIFFFVRSGMRTAIDNYTTDKPVSISVTAIDQSAIDAGSAKAAELQRLLKDTKGSGEVIFSQSDINGLLRSAGWQEQVLATISGDAVSAQFSVPLSAFGDWERARIFIGDKLDRFVTGHGTARGLVENGVARIDLKELALNGHVFDEDSAKSASEWVSGAVESKTESGESLVSARFERVWIENGEVHIRVKPQ